MKPVMRAKLSHEAWQMVGTRLPGIWQKAAQNWNSGEKRWRQGIDGNGYCVRCSCGGVVPETIKVLSGLVSALRSSRSGGRERLQKLDRPAGV